MTGKVWFRLGAICLAALVITQVSAMDFNLDLLENNEIAEEFSDDEVIGLRPQDGPEPGPENLEDFAETDAMATSTARPGCDGPKCGCKDTYPAANRCPYWARLGYCTHTTFGKWMKIYCRHSCNACKPCYDLSSYCATYVQRKYCILPNYFAIYGSYYCPASCGMCTPNHKECKDRYPQASLCPTWSKRYCGHNYVRHNCRKSCKQCHVCADQQSSTFCKGFLASGHCNSTVPAVKESMMANCRRTCNLC